MPEKKTKKKIEVEKPRIVEKGNYSVVISANELLSLIQILGFSVDVFAQVSTDRKSVSDEKASAIWGARSELSLMLYRKFRDVAEIGEPTSGEVH